MSLEVFGDIVNDFFPDIGHLAVVYQPIQFIERKRSGEQEDQCRNVHGYCGEGIAGFVGVVGSKYREI